MSDSYKVVEARALKIRILTQKIESLHERLAILENQQQHYENQKIVGKCYKYMNSFGGGSKAWPLYIRVVGLHSEDTGIVIVTKFETMENNEVRFETTTHSGRFDSTWTEISPDEYTVAFEAMMVYLRKHFDAACALTPII